MGWFEQNGFGDPTASAGPAGRLPFSQGPIDPNYDPSRPQATDQGPYGWNAAYPQFNQDDPAARPYGAPGSNTGGDFGMNGEGPFRGGSNPQAAALWQQAGQDPGKFIQLWTQANGLTPNQQDPASINSIVGALRSVGVNAESAGTDGNGHTDGIHINGQGFKLIDGSNHWIQGLQTYDQAEGSGGGGMGSLGALADFHAPAPFAGLSPEEFRNTPGYQFAMEQGMKGIQNSAAARGTLLTGGTLKALQGYGTGLADQTYGSAFNRALATNTTNFGQALQTNQQNNQNWFNIASLGRPS